MTHSLCAELLWAHVTEAGGPEGFRKLVDCIHAHGMKVVVESTMRVSTHQLHRKYQGLVCHTNDEFGRKVPHVSARFWCSPFLDP